jgi:hypothetical protein
VIEKDYIFHPKFSFTTAQKSGSKAGRSSESTLLPLFLAVVKLKNNTKK